MGLGSDTRGSVRIPAALNGVAGFKPTARRVPREGAFPLSFVLDSVGPLAPSIACCAAYDAVLADDPSATLTALPARGLRLMLPRSSALDGLDAHVGKTFEEALARLAGAGATVTEVAMPAFDRQDRYFKGGGFAGAEAAAIHRKWSHRIGEYDPRIGQRIALGDRITGPDLVEIGLLREAYMREVEAAVAPFDAIVMPTLPCIAPSVAEASASDEAYFQWNARLLRNCGLINFLDGCAATVPCQARGTAPVGLMVCGTALSDRRILAVANAIEAALSPRG
jgi:aspartyl-tRNA(Asn)/glutamyl-tRNA(Gln) amidotransferase subunit A